MNQKYKDIYQKSINSKEEFWKNISDDIFWYKKPTKILNSQNPPFYKWFEDGITNTCYNALDLHIDNGRGNKLAIIYDSPITGIQKKITYNELRNQVELFAGALRKQGVYKGDRVIIYMPMIPQAVIAMLACGRIGAVHSVVFGGFAANELASRIDDSKAKLIVTASCGYEPGRTVQKKITYNELRNQVELFAGALRKQGVNKGDRVIIYMPMIPQAVIAMLACGRIGAVHSVVFGGFAANELASRIDDSKAKLIVTASCGYEPGRTVHYKPLVNKALELAKHKPDKCIIFQREKDKAELNPSIDITWEESLNDVEPAECEKMNANDYAYILYTSGTTGLPKGIVRDIGGHIVALKWTMKNIYNIGQDDVWWSASDIGWIVGHSYIVYAPLFYGCTTVLFEGKPVGTPDAGVFWRVISEHKVKSLFTAPTAIRAIKKEDPKGEFFKKYDLSKFDKLFLAGERADPDTIKWFENLSNSPVIDHWWQTETSWAITSDCTGIESFPVKYGSAFKPVPGYDLKVLNSEGKEVGPGKMGDIVVKLPLPPGTFPTLWGADTRYKENYMSTYPGYYLTYDAGHIDEDGYVWIMSRTDDIINVAGHRLSTGAIEEVLAEHKDVAECAVLGIADKLKGQIPIGLLALKAGVTNDKKEIISECIKMVRDKVGPVAAFKLAVIVKRLPKTRSGKILRGTVRKIADNEPYKMPATIDDPAILDEIKADLIENKILKL